MIESFQLGIGQHRVKPGAHICYWGDEKSGLRAAADVLSEGLSRGERCVLVGNDNFADAVFARLLDRGIDPHKARKAGNGNLVVLYGQSIAVELLGSIVSQFEGRKGTPVRMVGCPCWGDPDWPDFNDFLAHESLLDTIVPQYGALCVCIHNPRSALPAVLHVHPKII